VLVATDRQSQIRQQLQQTRPELDLGPAEVFGLLKHATAMLDLLLEPVFETATLNSAEFDVLFQLRFAGEPMIARRLALAMGRSAAALSKSLAKLEQRGLVTREANPSDRRAALVSITPTGAEAVDEVFPRRLSLESEAVASLTAEQLAQVTASLQLLAQAVETRARR
jgi:DNA-binding MarR family transcriptional regulator